MFDMKSMCNNCPFNRLTGHNFNLSESRIIEISNATAFQCHNTVEYGEYDDGEELTRAGNNPQQCVGLMSMLHSEGRHNQIMQLAERLLGFDVSTIDSKKEAYRTLREAIEAHRKIRRSK